MSLHPAPLISIVICTYNGEKYIKEQLDSLVNQTYQNLEIIAIDDCSSDSTPHILKDYLIKYPALRFYENDLNLGYVKNFEKGLLLCNGDYILLSDQDDIWDLNKVNHMYDHIGKNILLYHDSEFIDKRGESMNKKMSDLMTFFKGNDGLPFLLFNCVSGHTMMFRKELIKLALPFDKDFFHDWWLAYVAASLGSINFVDKALVKYRQHNQSTIDILELKEDKKEEEHLLLSKTDWIKKCAKLSSPQQKYIHKIGALLIQKHDFWTKIRLYFHLKKKVSCLMFIRKDTPKHNLKVLKKSTFSI